ncbi:MAG: phosphoethanolamine transferase [Phascolarctobacterium sp.]|nr:phosphoethanolamine transferase [Phascolarctobacterium sp.]
MITKFNINKKFILLQTIIFLLTGVSVPLFYKLSKNLNIDGAFVWDELSTSLSIIFIFLSLTLLLELFASGYKKLKAILLTILMFLIFAPYLLALSYYFITGDFVDVNSLIALYQTNITESLEFLTSSINFITGVLLSLFIFVLVIALYILNSSSVINTENLKSKLCICLIIFFSMVSVFLFTKTSNSMYFNRIIYQSQDYIKAIIEYKKFRSEISLNNRKLVVSANNVSENATFLVIIGESQNKNHMSVYGYERNTTPWLNSMKDDSNFIFFNHAYACHTLTMKALSQALTESNQYNNKSFAKSYSLVDIAKAAGFETYWISNQAKYGTFSSPVSVIAEMADHQIWLNIDDNTGIVYDEEILLNLDKVNKNTGKKIVFIHLMGNHWEYKKRYPEKFSNEFVEDQSNIIDKAKNKNKLNEYDSSMLYNDYVVKRIFEYAKQNWNLYNMIYFSDHGEAVLSDNKHIPGRFELDMIEIPVYIYCSDEYVNTFGNKFNSLKKRNKVFFTNDMMFDTIINIWNVESNVYEPKYDILSNEFVISKNELRSLEGDKILFN